MFACVWLECIFISIFLSQTIVAVESKYVVFSIVFLMVTYAVSVSQIAAFIFYYVTFFKYFKSYAYFFILKGLHCHLVG